MHHKQPHTAGGSQQNHLHHQVHPHGGAKSTPTHGGNNTQTTGNLGNSVGLLQNVMAVPQ
jgi:hypothetical protein